MGKAPYMDCRAGMIHQLGQEFQALTRWYQSLEEKEKQPLAMLRNIIWMKLMTLGGEEWHWRKGFERARKQAAFINSSIG